MTLDAMKSGTAEKRAFTRDQSITSKNGGKTVGGYAAVFNSRTEIGDGGWKFIEVISPGAFSESVGGDVFALYSHEWERVIGRTKNGTLRLKEDDKGLAVEIDLPDTNDGRDLATLVERGDITGMSFGFTVTKQEWDETGPVPVRTILAVDLYEVSAVALPAYEDTSIAMRSFNAAKREKNHNSAMRRIQRKADAEARFRGLK